MDIIVGIFIFLFLITVISIGTKCFFTHNNSPAHSVHLHDIVYKI